MGFFFIVYLSSSVDLKHRDSCTTLWRTWYARGAGLLMALFPSHLAWPQMTTRLEIPQPGSGNAKWIQVSQVVNTRDTRRDARRDTRCDAVQVMIDAEGQGCGWPNPTATLQIAVHAELRRGMISGKHYLFCPCLWQILAASFTVCPKSVQHLQKAVAIGVWFDFHVRTCSLAEVQIWMAVTVICHGETPTYRCTSRLSARPLCCELLWHALTCFDIPLQHLHCLVLLTWNCWTAYKLDSSASLRTMPSTPVQPQSFWAQTVSNVWLIMTLLNFVAEPLLQQIASRCFEFWSRI